MFIYAHFADLGLVHNWEKKRVQVAMLYRLLVLCFIFDLNKLYCADSRVFCAPPTPQVNKTV